MRERSVKMRVYKFALIRSNEEVMRLIVILKRLSIELDKLSRSQIKIVTPQ